MDTCPRCKAYVQPEWDRCKICGLERLPDAPAPLPAPPVPAAAAAGPGPAGAGPQRPPSPRPSSGSRSAVGREVIAVGVVGFVLIIAAVAFVLRPSSSDTSAGAPASTTPGTIVPGAGDLQATQMAARAVCVGNQASIPGAGAYPGAAGAPHPIVVARDEIEDASLTVPSAWTRSERDALDRPVELILCSRVERLGGSQNCGGYGGVRVDVQDATWTIEVRAASTGEIVGQTVLPGTEGCPGGVMVAPGEPQVLANRPNRSEVNTFVESYVMAP